MIYVWLHRGKVGVMLLQVTQSQQVSDNVDETYPFNLQ